MKTVKEWFESVENPILRKVLLMRYDKEFSENVETVRLEFALSNAFYWNHSIEGEDFWDVVYDELFKSNESPTFNAKYRVMQVEWLDENECIYCETVVEKSQIESLLSNRISYVITGSPDSERCYIILNPKFPAVYLFRPETYTIYPAKLFIENILKLKTMTELPEYFVIKREADNPLWDKYIQWINSFKGCNIDKNQSMNEFISFDTYIEYWDCFNNLEHCKKTKPILITLEQWDSIVNKTQINMKQSLTLGQLKDLVNADSCTEWKTRLFNILKSYYSYKDDTVFEIGQEDIDYAKQRCSPKQLQLLKDAGLVFEEECPYKVGDWIININPEIEEDRIAYKIKHITDNCYLLETNIPHKHFAIKYDGLRKATQEEIDYASIDWDKLKTGSVVMLNVNLCDGDIDKPFNIVLINTNFTITNEKGDYDCGKKRFVKWSDIDGSSSAKKDLITFYQNNKFFVVGQDNIKDLITKVISY
jgi:hypothetical protein